MDVRGADAVDVAVCCGTGHVRIVQCNLEDGSLELKSSSKLAQRPMFAACVDSTHFVTVSQRLSEGDDSQGAILAVAVDKDTKAAFELSRVPCGGKGPCHIALSPDKTLCAVTNYETGHITCCVVDPAIYHLQQPLSITRVGPAGYTNKGRQDGSHPHQAIFSKDARSLYVCDLGTNVVNRFTIAEDGTLHRASTLELRPGAGPRHLVFHPALAVAYILHELDNGLTVADVDANGDLSIRQVVECVPADYDAPPPFDFYTANSHAAEVALSPDATFVLCTNRGHDSLALFAIDLSTGEVKLTSHTKTKGALPWHAAFLSPSLVIVTTQFDKGLKSGGFVEVFQLEGDPATLRPLSTLPVEEPMCALPLF